MCCLSKYNCLSWTTFIVIQSLAYKIFSLECPLVLSEPNFSESVDVYQPRIQIVGFQFLVKFQFENHNSLLAGQQSKN